MYSEPHEFDVNIPRILSTARSEDYNRYVWPVEVPRLLCGWQGLVAGALVAFAVMLTIAVLHVGWSALARTPDRAESPYVLIPYPVLVILFSATSAYAVAVLALAARTYWVEVGPAGRRVSSGAMGGALWYAATLRYLRGGGANCYYPKSDQPSASRRWLHGLVAYGFALCFVSTISAAVLQDIIGRPPPYPWLSVPVIAGTVGGVGLVAGSSALLALKARSEPVTSVAQMTVKDYGLLVALSFLALSGLATLLTRDTAAFGLVLLVHLSSVMLAIASAPYSKFSHVVFRFLAILNDNMESVSRLTAS